MHSHNYSPQQAYKRSFGEAKALAAVWNEASTQINFPRTVLLGWTNDARRDLFFCARRKRLHEWPHAARIRWQQRRAKLAGFREGWKFYRNGHAAELRKSGLDRVPPHAPGRFTIDGSEALEKHLANMCEKILASVRAIIPENRLGALVLGGGYGRGQGGVLKTSSGDAPYNDLEFYVFMRGNRVLNERNFHRPLEELGERVSTEAGLHVEFKVDSLERLHRGPITMFSYDLVSGHRTLLGGETIFYRCEQHRDAAAIPLAEGTRLLFNRCTGLLLAKERLAKRELTVDDADFVGRNLAKGQLALGDVILVVAGKYHWSCLERKHSLEELAAGHGQPWIEEAQRHHAAGVDFKLHPRRFLKSRAEFEAEHKEISRLANQAWLWLESRRLGRAFSSAREYAFSGAPKCAEVAAGRWRSQAWWRNVLLNARTFGAGSLFDRAAARYPRERLLNSLPLLLWDEPLNDFKAKYFLQKELRTTASDWQGFVAAYKAVWPKFS